MLNTIEEIDSSITPYILLKDRIIMSKATRCSRWKCKTIDGLSTT